MNDAGVEHPNSGPSLAGWFQVEAGRVAGDRVSQNVFTCESRADESAALTFPLETGLQGGPVTFCGTLAEWSLDAVGRLAGLLADLSAREGASSPVLPTISRTH
ncbi:hypothetical protein [Actinosynnema mirum]|uniref:Uncharacterized protein n=1 Tax=Actinosynnema mirum (strain ATCC 29888 / DSM 43827 / JCM 3225 / NBRC 14064 / NCIMB 13271 / NRRL B-12336 / IMRU 3971 / 101) TaxID=446462 RepID=C6W9L8_ACTMD|nr:hypothetical protein [Actinosynnema mirum]ACU37235.1 hypothetical protein Amir_3330 [Actinosynnema mirum DSM 43827]